jgi:hypothetical protein
MTFCKDYAKEADIPIPKSSGTLGIVFMHHHVDEVVINNLNSIRRHNPDATIVTVSAGERFPGGYALDTTPDYKRFHSGEPRATDRLLSSWFFQRKETCDKWWLVEWDVFCTTSVRDYYKPVWDFPFVASAVYLRNRDPEWLWFRFLNALPGDYKPHVVGAAPFLYLVDESVLSAVCTILEEKPFFTGNCEMRFATAARRCGYGPCGFSPPNDRITWKEVRPKIDHPGIFHPIKHLVE